MSLNKFTFIAFWFSIALAASSAQASLILDFQMSDLTISGNTGTFTRTGLVDNGVAFDATITVTGSSVLNFSGSGLRVRNGGWLGFQTSVTTSGTVIQDGFNRIELSNFNGTRNRAYLSIDNSSATTGDNFRELAGGQSGASFAEVPVFHAIAGAGNNNQFRATSVSFQFTGVTPIPEPSSAVMVATAWLICSRRRR